MSAGLNLETLNTILSGKFVQNLQFCSRKSKIICLQKFIWIPY